MYTTALVVALACAPTADLRNHGDAPLHCVRFVDRQEGWAAGADGVVWHTLDGGATWEPQPVPTKGTLHGMQFVTPYIGYVAGREEIQASGGSAGVLLATRDGGLNWARIAPGALPGLHAVAFTDDRSGIVAGDTTDRWPGGLFRTVDGGRSWQPIPALRGGGWRAASFQNEKNAALVGSWARIGILRDGEYAPADVDAPKGRHVQAVAQSEKLTVAVGQRGLVLISDTAGQRYRYAELGLDTAVLADADFRGVACHGQQIWIVGSPGSIVFHSTDGGANWQRQGTGQALPLNAIHFVDATNGWAVGEMGTVLATRDGGATWVVQRCGGQRAAVLCFHAYAKNTPFDLLATLGADAGYLMTNVVVATPDPTIVHPQRATEDLRLIAAIRKSGGAAGITLAGFSLPPHLETADKDAVVAHWNTQHSGHALERLTADLALAIRMWQPEIVVTDFAGSPPESLLVESVQAACLLAKEPAPIWNLAGWTPKRVYSLWDGPGAAHTTIATTEYSRVLGDSPREYAHGVRGLISTQNCPKNRGLRLLSSTAPTPAGSHPLDGIALAPGGTARRAAPIDQGANGKELEKNLREMRTIQAVATGADAGATLARINPLLDRLPQEQGASSALALARQYAETEQWDLARETYGLALTKYAGQPAGLEALRWLIQYQASGEFRRRYELRQSVTLSRTEFGSAVGKQERYDPGTGIRPLADASTERHRSLVQDPASARQWLQAAVELEPRLAAYGTLAASDPALQFSLASAKRQLGDLDAGKSFFRRFLAEQSTAKSDDPWRLAARQELWIGERLGQPQRFAIACRKTNQRPHLDAKFDDPCWIEAVPASLKAISGKFVPEAYSAVIRFAFDDENLYVALECQHPSADIQPAIERRYRDADLTQSDRVELLLDMDRDYSTWYRFRIDLRGSLAEDCCGDASWNPRWFVAFQNQERGYSAEIAIPLAELTSSIPSTGQAWAINAVRILPGRGALALSAPAETTVRPEGFGLLTFIGDGRR